MTRQMHNYALNHLNTFQVAAKAKVYVPFSSFRELMDFTESDALSRQRFMVLGGGSNILFTKDFDGIVLHPLIKGITPIDEDSDHILLSVNSGENWDDFVGYCVKKKIGGLENLSGIPGSVGAAPIQNIGAYGVEVENAIHRVETVNIRTRKKEIFHHKKCQFGYRSSIFKRKLRGTHIVTSVIFKLNKHPDYILGYGKVKKEVEKLGDVSLSTIRQAVLNIRAKKLPDPSILPNAGSFFKNPIIDQDRYDALKKEYPHLISYPIASNRIKIPAAFLIEASGYKGKRVKDVATHRHHALIIVNVNGATGESIFEFSQRILRAVQKKFSITLEREVRVV